MIISASRRTDIPAFYSEWFMNRIRAGFVLVPNPFNRHQTRHVPLGPQHVETIVFWTRNSTPLLPHLQELDALGYRYYFQYTITGYPRTLERATPSLKQAVDSFRKLSEHTGPDRVLWRYDPILICNHVSLDDHLKRFTEIAAALQGKTYRVTISFVEFYRKTTTNLRSVKGLTCYDITRNPEQMKKLVQRLSRIAEHYGMEIRTCATDFDHDELGVISGKCIDNDRIRKSFGIDYPSHKDTGQRSSCNCVKSIDIGQYNTCTHDCTYCYATYNTSQAAENRTLHIPGSPLLIGQPPNTITIPKPRQQTLF